MIHDVTKGFTLPGGNNLASSVLTTQKSSDWWRTPDSLPYILDAQAKILNRIPFANNAYVQKVLAQAGAFSFLDELGSFFGSPFYIQYSIGGYFFDGIIRADHTKRVKLTDHPVQTGATITDHAIIEPKELSIEVAMSDVMSDKVQGQFGSGNGRSQKAFDVLTEMQEKRRPLQVVTRLATYENMMITSIEVPDDFKTTSALRAMVTFKEVLMASVSEIKISARPDSTDSTDRGTIQAESVEGNQTLLKRLEGVILS